MKLHCPLPVEGTEVHPFFYFRYVPEAKVSGLFKESLPPNYFGTEAQYVGDVANADAIVLPNNFRIINAAASSYIQYWADKGNEFKIPLYIFSFGDFTDLLKFDPRVNVFRLSMYRSESTKQDISTPTLTEDIGREGLALRKKNDVPVVSFCGQAGYKKPLQWIKYYLKLLRYAAAPERRLGVYWRRRMMSACRGSEDIDTNFIIRKSFSGAHSTIELEPTRARTEFIGSIRDADFVLAPKGDGNYSNRFLEALSMGRIPVVVDTDIVLPFDDRIDYSRIMVRVPMGEVSNTPQYIRAFYDALTEEEWQERQKEARHIFETYLRQDSFFRQFFTVQLP